MIRLALVAAAGFLALALTACGDHGSKPPQPTAGNMQQQQGAAPQQPAQDQQQH